MSVFFMNEHRECWEGKFRSKRSKKFLLFLDQKKIKTSSSRPRFDCQLYSQHFLGPPPIRKVQVYDKNPDVVNSKVTNILFLNMANWLF